MESLRFFNVLKLWVNKYYVVSQPYMSSSLAPPPNTVLTIESL